MPIDRLIGPFALPGPGDWSPLYDAVAQGAALGCLRSHREQALGAGRADLADLFSGASVASLRHPDAWSPFFARGFVSGEDAPDLDHLLHLALFLVADGSPIDVAGEFAAPTPVLFGDLRVAAVSRFRMEAHGELASFRTGCGTVRIPARRAADPGPPPGEEVRPIRRVATIGVLARDDLPSSWRACLPLDREGIEILAEPDGAADVLGRALDLLESVPEYRPWVLDMISWLVPVRSRPGRLLSGSTLAAPGLVYASGDCRPIALAESLVHEASHQRFYQLNSIHPLYLADSDWAAWSPFVGRPRPANGLLLGYHAFANVGRLYASLARLPEHREESERQLRTTSEALDACERSLRESPALTPAGRDFLGLLIEARPAA